MMTKKIEMDAQIIAVRDQLQKLRDELHDGNVYQTLGQRVSHIILNTRRRQRTTVTLPPDVAQLEEWLALLIAKDYHVTHVSQADLDLVLPYLRSTDYRTRYGLALPTLIRFVDSGVLSADQFRWLALQLLGPDYLFNHILEPVNRGAFGRAAATRLLAVVMEYENNHPGTVHLNVDHFVIQIATYICLETDTRGFVTHSGQLTTFSEMAFLMDRLGAGDWLPRADKIFLMVILFECLKQLKTPLYNGELTQISSYLTTLANRNVLYESALLDALNQWPDLGGFPSLEDSNTSRWNLMFNGRRLAGDLCFQLDLPKRIQDNLMRRMVL